MVSVHRIAGMIAARNQFIVHQAESTNFWRVDSLRLWVEGYICNTTPLIGTESQAWSGKSCSGVNVYYRTISGILGVFDGRFRTNISASVNSPQGVSKRIQSFQVGL